MTDILLLTFIFLIAGVIAVPIASRLGLGSVLGYLIAGIAISPVLALLHVDVVSIQHFAEFGVVMMLFLVGLELEPKLLWSMRAKLIGLGGHCRRNRRWIIPDRPDIPLHRRRQIARIVRRRCVDDGGWHRPAHDPRRIVASFGEIPRWCRVGKQRIPPRT